MVADARGHGGKGLVGEAQEQDVHTAGRVCRGHRLRQALAQQCAGERGDTVRRVAFPFFPVGLVAEARGLRRYIGDTPQHQHARCIGQFAQQLGGGQRANAFHLHGVDTRKGRADLLHVAGSKQLDHLVAGCSDADDGPRCDVRLRRRHPDVFLPARRQCGGRPQEGFVGPEEPVLARQELLLQRPVFVAPERFGDHHVAAPHPLRHAAGDSDEQQMLWLPVPCGLQDSQRPGRGAGLAGQGDDDA